MGPLKTAAAIIGEHASAFSGHADGDMEGAICSWNCGRSACLFLCSHTCLHDFVLARDFPLFVLFFVLACFCASLFLPFWVVVLACMLGYGVALRA